MTSTITTLKHLQISLEEVVKATNNFDEEYVIGGGGFGKVYRGQLLVSGEMVDIAARRLDPKHRGGGVEFWTEISVLSGLEHENIFSLIGFCDENGEKIIINKDEATKGSLSMYLSDPTTLTWIQRLNICVGVARALRYIHSGEGRGSSVIHRNINSYTVLLDAKFEAKLSGFEYSIKQSVNRMDRVVLSEAVGTKGYMDPSIVKTRGVSHKSDIYSFGVVLCEILCGRKAFIPNHVDNRFLAPLFIFHYENKSLNNIIHPDLRHQMTRRSLTRLYEVAYSCLKEDRVQRPKMNDIVIELEKAFELQQPLENLIQNMEHLKIPLGDIMLATDNFSEDYRIGYDDFCNLYIAEIENFEEENPSIKEGRSKDELPRRRNTILIKRILLSEDDSETGEEMFYTEIKMLDVCKHPGIVKLIGFSNEGSEMILVVEQHCNGILLSYWNNTDMRQVLTWEKRLKICLDVANALNYLHTEMEDQKTIIHRDIRSYNIALDENFGAKIIDFRRSVFLPPNDDYILHNIIYGTRYYIDPEYKETTKLKRESDVYNFGVVLIEFLCGKSASDPIYLKDGEQGMAIMARRCFREGTPMEMIDPILKGESCENSVIPQRGPKKVSLEKFVKIAHQCIAQTQDQRPTMKVVIRELQKALFFQETHLDVVHVADAVEESIELNLSRENSVMSFIF
uniref:probable receptor-like protein kinase At5g59700 n=1 Tax=Erigeron canadensis TaxID=72917 RepID=UPI001CB8ED2D|nr:probable receptor-like protein kinase At5g59700 [Erigeron canadensis]